MRLSVETSKPHSRAHAYLLRTASENPSQNPFFTAKPIAGLDIIADSGITEADLVNGYKVNQGMVTPFFQTYEEVRRSINQRLNDKGPVEILKSHIPADSSQWNDVIFVSQTQVIEEMATKTLSQNQGAVAKMMANFTRLMNYALGNESQKEHPQKEASTPERATQKVKEEIRSPGVP